MSLCEVGVCWTVLLWQQTSGIKMLDRLNGSSTERRMEPYKFSTNWLLCRTQKPADERLSAPEAKRNRGWHLMLFSSFTSSYFFHNSHFCLLLFHRGHKHIPVVRFATAHSLPPPCVCARAQWYHGDTGSFTSRHLTLSHRSHTRIKTGIPPFITPSLAYHSFAPFHQYLNLHPCY